MADLENFDLEKFEQEVFSEIREAKKILKQESGTKIVRVELNEGLEIVTTIQHKHLKPPSPPPPPFSLWRTIVRRPSFVFAIGVITGIAVAMITLLVNHLLGGEIFLLLFSIFKPSTFLGILAVLVIFVTSMFVREQIVIKQEANKNKKAAMRQRQSEEKQRQAEEKAKQRLAKLPEIQQRLNEAEKIVNNPDIRKLLCPALLAVTNDAFEYSKIMTPILVGAVIAKTIVLPLDSALFAAISIVAARCGASVICANYTAKK